MAGEIAHELAAAGFAESAGATAWTERRVCCEHPVWALGPLDCPSRLTILTGSVDQVIERPRRGGLRTTALRQIKPPTLKPLPNSPVHQLHPVLGMSPVVPHQPVQRHTAR